ncbi:unnamed protein product [Kuraishia capsulata CBS 1993]|uniref:Uncharacterized protein n=1 Tax=Kuraishia capsulata CBS 1993 TaxID=1382522 RepID=W6MNB4_9ASCO|nr:uncharacterized protein KUCA_T00003747001 [Kuraishia capsulata CBS 1993]CDK27768.1 unnamed protein product [Kuraishia capsulata CBS 1993]
MVRLEYITDYFKFISQLQDYADENGLELHHGFDFSSVPVIEFNYLKDPSAEYAITEEELDKLADTDRKLLPSAWVVNNIRTLS